VRKVFIYRGPSGSGKSTHIRNNYPDYPVCSADHLFEREGPDGEKLYEFDPSLLPIAHQQCFAAFISLVCIEQARRVIVDNTNMAQWEMFNYVHLAEAMGYEVEIIDFTPKTLEGLCEAAERGKSADATWRQAQNWEEIPLDWDNVSQRTFGS